MICTAYSDLNPHKLKPSEIRKIGSRDRRIEHNVPTSTDLPIREVLTFLFHRAQETGRKELFILIQPLQCMCVCTRAFVCACGAFVRVLVWASCSKTLNV
jgi:hypothetical protein